MIKVYISHALNGDGSPEWGNRDNNFRRYLRICAWATNQGVTVCSWAHHHLMHAQGLTGDDPEFYLKRDERLIDGCDELWVACPTDVSEGVRREILYATKKGIITRFITGDWANPSWPSDEDMAASAAEAALCVPNWKVFPVYAVCPTCGGTKTVLTGEEVHESCQKWTEEGGYCDAGAEPESLGFYAEGQDGWADFGWFCRAHAPTGGAWVEYTEERRGGLYPEKKPCPTCNKYGVGGKTSPNLIQGYTAQLLQSNSRVVWSVTAESPYALLTEVAASGWAINPLDMLDLGWKIRSLA